MIVVESAIDIRKESSYAGARVLGRDDRLQKVSCVLMLDSEEGSHV